MATETAEFLQRKRQILASLDRSPKGSLDAPIVDFLSWLNEQEGVVTTSSCSGRIAIFHGSADLNNSKGGQWLLASHALVDVPETWAQLQQSLEGQSDATGTLTTLLLEPFVLHAECVDATLGQTMLSAAREAGFRESGLSLGRKRVMVQIRTLALRLEVPLASDGRLLVDGNYFQTLLEIANRRLEENFARTQRLWAQLREALQRTEATPAEPWVLICASSLARGVKLALEARAWMDTDRKMQKLEGAESKIGVPLTMEAAEHFQALAASRAEASDQMAREPADVDQEKQKAEALPSPAAPRPPKSQRPPTSAADLEALWQTGALSLTRAELPGKAKPASHTDASHGKGVNLEEVILNLLKPLPLEKQQSLVSEKMLAEARSVVVQWRGDVALLPRGGALGSEWDALADLKALPAGLWESMRDALGARLLARQQEIRVDDEVRGGNVQVLAGSGSPWVVVPGPRGVRYSFDITKCMFSEGNAAEKERVAAWPVQGETILDMYAGIGFWTLPLLAAGAEHVFACEWNPHALEGLREGLRLLGAPGSCEVLAGDNRRDEVCPEIWVGTAGAGKKWSLVEPDLKPAYYQICAHEGVEKATAWLNQAKAKKAGRNDAMKDLAAALKKEEEATAKKAELHTLKGIKAAECKKHLENSPHAHLVKKAKFCASPAAYPHGDPCPECEKHGREGKIEQKVSKDGKPYAACSTFTPARWGGEDAGRREVSSGRDPQTRDRLSTEPPADRLAVRRCPTDWQSVPFR
ncbi:unnamed protein product [Durusdinium trenchii]|uniref:tRNA(Phe) 7-[(3-amino-3-carboxypropyl)-4-demethylwyosine(37)-N(4)]-methyltransferase n=1 Tax=Durusdinium trenchii TaxID=1381693 RepID=A0ABP0KFR6_9DINO